MKETKTLKEAFDEKLKSQWFTKEPKRKGKFKKRRLSKEREKTGFRRTKRIACPKCVQGFLYKYSYFDNETKKQKHFTSTDFMKLKEKAKKKNLAWEIDDTYYARKTAKEVGLPLRDLK